MLLLALFVATLLGTLFYFFFSGPRLHPVLSVTNVALALAIVLVVSGASSIYPGFLAMRVSPRQAMQSDE